MPDIASLSTAATAGLFIAAALVVWFAGTRLAGYANAIGNATGVGKAFLGLLLLGGITSLPELATSMSAAYRGNADLAVNNLLGGVAMQVAVLGVADAALTSRALTSIVASPVVMLQGALDIVLLTLVAVAILIGDTGVLGIGYWVWILIIASVFALWQMHGYEKRPAWQVRKESPDESGGIPRERAPGELPPPARAPDLEHAVAPDAAAELGVEAEAGETHRQSLRRLIIRTTLAGAAIFVAGYVLAVTGESIADRSGLGSSFVGAVLVAITTSLPEASTVYSAVKLGQYELAISDIFGTNLITVALLFVVDLMFTGGYALNEVGRLSVIAALLGVAVTAIFMAGLIERADRAYLRAGPDSWLVVATYLGGVALLYQLR